MLFRQVTLKLKENLESINKCPETKSIQGIMEIMGMMHKACHQHYNTKQSVMTEVSIEKYLFLLYQKPEMSNTK